MYSRKISRGGIAVFAAGVALAGCGLSVPEMQEWYEPPESQKITENRIISHIKCELHKGMDDAINHYRAAGIRSGYPADWLHNWLATVNLKLTGEEKGGVNPGVSWFRALSDVRSFTLGAGFNASADATRVETISFTYPLSNFRLAGRIKGPCEEPAPRIG